MNMMKPPARPTTAPQSNESNLRASGTTARAEDHITIKGRAPLPITARTTAPHQAARQAPAAPARPVTPTNRADDLMMVVRQLTDLLTKENMALKRHKAAEVKAMTERKEQLARLYQQQLNALHRDPSIAKSMDPVKRNQLAQAAIKLGALMQENASLLKANISVINKFLNRVMDAVKERQQSRAAAYSKEATYGNYGMAKRQLAVSYNQTL
jgi:hypothetical protein